MAPPEQFAMPVQDGLGADQQQKVPQSVFGEVVEQAGVAPAVFQALDEPVPQVCEVAVGVLLALIDEEQAGRPYVDEFLAAVLNRDGGDPRTGHQHDLQLRLPRQ
ncbi:hypothetical protein L4B83_05915 [Streptomyces sp. PSAA01]|nr:hypothetical protein [Streptomyces sp. PSAA01]MCG0284533.1 hypothetical protein [Streptomyces sp. PSAA01]